MIPSPFLHVDVAAALARHGLIPRGAVDLAIEERTLPGTEGGPAGCVLLVGHAGGAIWPHFKRWRAEQPTNLRDPLDAWSREVLEQIGAAFGARPIFPSDRPYLPFQQWAMMAEGLKPSPLGILMHPEYGLWHAYRGALVFSQPVVNVPAVRDGVARAPVHLCDSCEAKPCLSGCPVGAHSIARFDYERCVGHVRSAAGHACGSGGCLDRNACPYGTEYRYSDEQQAFHMTAFAGL